MRWNLLLFGLSLALLIVLIIGPGNTGEGSNDTPRSQRLSLREGGNTPTSSLQARSRDSVFNDPVLDVAEPDRFSPAFYDDPTGNGQVALIMVAGLENEYVSPHFRIRDLMARDGAPYARIDLELVNTLEQLVWLADTTIHIQSAYRHPALNADDGVGGAAQSQHLAGRAVDLWSDDLSPGALAELVLTVTECTIGIGLGRTFVHVDLRGHLATWAQPDAAMDEATFDTWALARCDAQAEKAGATSLSFAETARLSAIRSGVTASILEDTLVARYRIEMAAFARIHFREQGKGAVVLDLQTSAVDPSLHVGSPFTYVLPGSEEARTQGLEALIPTASTRYAFPYLLIGPNGEKHIGTMSYATAQGYE